MTRWIDTLTDEAWLTSLGQRFEAVTEEIFSVLRWAIVVGFARHLSIHTTALWFDAIHWITGALLFAYLASRFLLRPEVPLFTSLDRRWKRRVQTAVNLGLCMLAFLLAMWLIEHLVDGIARYRFAPVVS
ncbi:hypothetical protein [Roseovarius sp. D22-M7]|uniref:hypothetical protein n=1 Tax=Roseovarius sp. D22-M7 TaxID=3127116 RepID=UPI00300F9416